MRESVVLGELREALVTHLVAVEEQSTGFIEEFFADSAAEREKIKEIVAEYIEKLKGLVQEAHLLGEPGAFPLVIIGSRVEVEDLNTKEKMAFQIISPFGELPDGNGISPLSPVGKALFLKALGEEVKVEAPGGTFHYRITAIHYPAAG
ncbi:MAG: GreA/GreB family elongation factor [Firmicutes bacterium]|nr:GreA/GreB family elongation factor [Bacillota bacterium]